jgi:2-enoate reductase
MVNMAGRVKEVVTIPVVSVGRLDKPEVAVRAVADGMADVVAIGRGLLADPEWADKVKSGNAEDIRPCVACYDACFGSYAKVRHISCALNPSCGRERAYRLEPAENPRNVMVIGGGVAGLEAARVASLRGHRVSLYEKEDMLGGLVRQAAVPEFKKDLRRLLAWYERQVEQNDIDVCLGCEITVNTVYATSPDVIIVATGARAIVPDIEGVDRESVVTAVDLLKGEKTIGERVVIVGGGLSGCEIAIWLAAKGRRSVIVEMLPDLMAGGAPVPGQVKMMTLDLLAKYNTTIHTDSRVNEVTAAGVTIDRKKGFRKDHIEADTIVLAMGMAPNTCLADRLEQIPACTYRIGDCRAPRNVMNAVWDAYEIARFI